MKNFSVGYSAVFAPSGVSIADFCVVYFESTGVLRAGVAGLLAPAPSLPPRDSVCAEIATATNTTRTQLKNSLRSTGDMMFLLRLGRPDPCGSVRGSVKSAFTDLSHTEIPKSSTAHVRERSLGMSLGCAAAEWQMSLRAKLFD